MTESSRNSVVELQGTAARLSELSLITAKLAGALPPKNQVGDKARKMLSVQFETLKILKEVIDYTNKLVQTIAKTSFTTSIKINEAPAVTSSSIKNKVVDSHSKPIYDIQSRVGQLTDTSHQQSNPGNVDEWDP